MNRRLFLLSAAAGAFAAPACAAPAAPEAVVYKTPTCGCCGGWVDHLAAAGFRTRVIVQEDLAPVRARYGVPDALTSCHTGVVGGYAVEGHVPAEDVKRLLRERPAARGVAVPGMPLGSPGMEVPGRGERYQTILIGRDGRLSVFAVHG